MEEVLRRKAVLTLGGPVKLPEGYVLPCRMSHSTAGPGAGFGSAVFQFDGYRVKKSVSYEDGEFELVVGKRGRLSLTRKGRQFIPRVEIVPVVRHCPEQAFFNLDPRCMYGCAYCTSPLLDPSEDKHLSTERIMEMLEESGAIQYVNLEGDRTWTTENFVKACEALRDAGYSVPGIVYCGGQGGDQGTRALVRNLYSADFTDAEHTKYTMNSDNGVKGLQLLIDMVNDKSMTYDAGIVASDELTLFANGTSCMSFCWNASNWATYASQASFTPFAMTFPTDDGQPELDGGIWGFGIVDKGDQAKIDAAKTFIDFVCNDESQASDSVYATGFFPARSSLGDIYAGTEKEGYSEVLMFMPYLGDYYNVTPKWSEQRTAWFEMLQAAFSSGDAASALAEYDAKANS